MAMSNVETAKDSTKRSSAANSIQQQQQQQQHRYSRGKSCSGWAVHILKCGSDSGCQDGRSVSPARFVAHRCHENKKGSVVDIFVGCWFPLRRVYLSPSSRKGQLTI
eukprot:scaffold28586_cov107-Skeletonema_dohrnii-CCMP3373.AAC.3